MPQSPHSPIDLRTNYSLKPQLTGDFALLASPGGSATTRSRSKPTPTAQKSVSQDDWKRASLSQLTDAYTDLMRADNDQRSYTMPSDRNSVSLNGNSQSKRRTQYYEEQFQYKDNVHGSARERVHREAPVIAELRTNVIIKDEFTLVTDLSYHLAARYTRPDSSIMINVDHSSCLALAGTFDPCYVLTITTLPSQIQATTNKRNAALIQSFMADILSVPPDRGIIKFTPILEDNYAMNGVTMLGEVERLERQQSTDGSVKRAVTDARKSLPNFKKGAPKIDTDFAREMAIKNGVASKERRKSSSGSISAESPVPNVFELASSEGEERPSTAHGGFAALNGLRLNGVSKEELNSSYSRNSGGRPNTFAGQSVPNDTSKDEPLPKAKSPERPKSSYQAPSKPKPDLAPASPLPAKKANIPTSPKPTRPTPTKTTSTTDPKRSAAASPTPPAGTKGAAPNTYLDNVTTTKRPERDSSSEDKSGNRDPAANTAKRRSNITATPRIPNSNSGPAPAPPPIPESRAPKVSKRKSFLSAFRNR